MAIVSRKSGVPALITVPCVLAGKRRFGLEHGSAVLQGHIPIAGI